MDKQFVPYEIALQLKELGFDIKTLAYYDMNGTFYPMGTIIGQDVIYFGTFIPKYQYKEDLEPLVAAPLWQQAFDWFRKNHGYEISLHKLLEEPGYMASIGWEDTEGYDSQVEGDTYEDTREKCLTKLIEIVYESKSQS